MSDFAGALSGLVTNGADNRFARLDYLTDIFGHSPKEAAQIDDAMLAAVRAAVYAAGAGLDGLALEPDLQATLLPILLCILVENFRALEMSVMSVVLGMRDVTKGCDCKACVAVARLQAELAIVEVLARQQQGVH